MSTDIKKLQFYENIGPPRNHGEGYRERQTVSPYLRPQTNAGRPRTLPWDDRISTPIQRYETHSGASERFHGETQPLTLGQEFTGVRRYAGEELMAIYRTPVKSGITKYFESDYEDHKYGLQALKKTTGGTTASVTEPKAPNTNILPVAKGDVFYFNEIVFNSNQYWDSNIFELRKITSTPYDDSRDVEILNIDFNLNTKLDYGYQINSISGDIQTFSDLISI
jgi:hypothetical protein